MIRALRGEVVGGTKELAFQYQANDLSRGWRVISLVVCDSVAPVSAQADGIVLHTQDVRQTTFDFDDNRVIGFAGRTVSGKAIEIMDPNHIIVSNLWMSNLDSLPTTYLLLLEELKVTDAENVIYQLKERAQGSIV